MNTYDETALTEAVTLLKSRGSTVPDMAKRFAKSERTIKRWLAELGRRGHRVVREGVAWNAPYTIVS